MGEIAEEESEGQENEKDVEEKIGVVIGSEHLIPTNPPIKEGVVVSGVMGVIEEIFAPSATFDVQAT